jgi:predicted N-formylglutamate amidohydrolase
VLLLTCEHGGNRVPREYRAAFAGARAALACHRGWDPGALSLARTLSAATGATLIASDVTRLLVDLNRSLDNPGLFSRYSLRLDATERERVLREYYRPYREAVTRAIATAPAGAVVVHVGVHSFTPVLRGERRDVHVGLLFDPARAREAAFCRAWRRGLQRERSRWRVGFNRPYRGTDDGLTTALRAELGPDRYLGIELELSQRLATRTGEAGRRVHGALARSIGAALAGDGA